MGFFRESDHEFDETCAHVTLFDAFAQYVVSFAIEEND